MTEGLVETEEWPQSRVTSLNGRWLFLPGRLVKSVGTSSEWELIEVPDLFAIRLAHLATVISVPVFLQFVCSLYPKLSGRMPVILSSLAAALQSLLILFIPAGIFQHTALWYHVVIALHVPYVLWIYGRAWKRGDSGVMIGTAGFILLIIADYCDVALYEAKSSGRNRGVVFSSSLSGFPTPSEMEMVEELMRPVPPKKRKVCAG